MAISVYDVRDTFAPARLVPGCSPAAAGTTRRRPPLSVLAAGAIGMVEAVGLLAVALHGLGGVLTAPSAPAGPLLAVALLVMAAWIVLAAGSGAALLDGSSRRLLVGVAVGELGLVFFLGLLVTVTPLSLPFSLPALLLLATAAPVGKLLLADAPSTTAWLAAGPRPVERRPDPATTHRGLATATLGVIGLTLGAVALLGPADQPARTGETASTTVYQP